MYIIKLRAQHRWKRSNNKCKEAVCDFPGCKWRAYASWFRKDDAFSLKLTGKDQNCPCTAQNCSATASWIAKGFVGKLRMNSHIDVKLLQKEVKMHMG
ncbi:hypothetical protein LINGRAHAP2_LOCUS23046 [Linum grandiflorum]